MGIMIDCSPWLCTILMLEWHFFCSFFCDSFFAVIFWGSFLCSSFAPWDDWQFGVIFCSTGKSANITHSFHHQSISEHTRVYQSIPEYIWMMISMQIMLNRPSGSLIGAAHATQVTYALGTLAVWVNTQLLRLQLGLLLLLRLLLTCACNRQCV